MEEGKGSNILPTTGTKKGNVKGSVPCVIPGGKENQGRQVLMLALGYHHI